MQLTIVLDKLFLTMCNYLQLFIPALHVRTGFVCQRIPRSDYCPKSLRRVSGQNSFITLNNVSSPICCPHLLAVLPKDRS